MATRPSNTVLIAALVLGISGLMMSNALLQRAMPKSEEELQREAAKQAAEDAKKATPVPSASPAPAVEPIPAASGPATDPTTLNAAGTDALLGPKDAKKEVVIAWRWTPAVQADSGRVWNAVEAVRKADPNVRVRLKNVDETPDEPTGIFVDGKAVSEAAADGTILPPSPAVLQGKP